MIWFKDGKQSGSHVGEFRDGKANGRGVFTRGDGDRYEGEFRDGKPDGQACSHPRWGDTRVSSVKEQ